MATNNRFIRTGGAYFRDTPEGYQAVGNESGNTLRQLQLGQLSSEEMPVSQFAGQRTLSLPSGDNTAYIQNQQPQTPQGNMGSPPQQPGANMDPFNTLMLDILKKSQGLNTADLMKKKRELQREVLKRRGEEVPEHLATLSPDQQNAWREANVGGIRSEIDANAYELEKAQQSIDNFFKVFQQVRGMNAEAAEKMVAPENIIANAARIIEADPDRMDSVLAGFNPASQTEIMGKLDYNKFAQKASAGEQFTLGEGQRRYDEFGNEIAYGGPRTFAPTKGGGEDEEKAQGEAINRSNVALREIDNALGLLSAEGANLSETSFGRSVGKVLPWGTSQTDLTGHLDTLRALVGFDALQKMRESSPTGGALGNITVKELEFLQSVEGSLNEKIRTETLTETIKQIRNSFARLKLVNSPEGTVETIDGVPHVRMGDQIVPQSSTGGTSGTTSSNIKYEILPD